MIEKQMVEMLNKLAEKLGVASAKIWEWSLLQVKVDIWTTILGFLLFFVLTVVFIYFVKKGLEKKWFGDKYDENVLVILIFVILGVLLITANIVVIKNINSFLVN